MKQGIQKCMDAYDLWRCLVQLAVDEDMRSIYTYSTEALSTASNSGG